ncbi:ATP-binding protein [Shouchella miscanthi]|uniref:histidine kinase n=1 Tax=Shouchella miscanthi TaxID=2598861 RepID=A0ABU6NPZ7_9BACI|nr:ATP-binding protein [Shouchella miscanthi]
MVIEKLIINVFAIVIPVLIYGLRAEGSWKIQRSLTMFLFMSGAVLLCLFFSINVGNIQWDLRYIPILLAFLYGGKRAGWGVAAIAVVGRIGQGGDLFLLGVVLIVLTALFYALCVNRFYMLPPRWSRIRYASLLLILPATIQTFGTLYLINYENHLSESWIAGWLYIVFLVVTVVLVTYLFETLLEKERIVAELVATEKDFTKGELVASIAHEVRNPLTVVKGFVQLLSEDKQHAEYHKLILSELDRAESIIYEFLNTTRPQTNATFHLNETAREVVALLTPYAQERSIQLTIGTCEQAIVNGNENKVKQALMNFVKNGIEASNEGDTVTIQLDRLKDRAQIEINDNGVGMSRQQLKQLGTAYFTTKESGNGIGTMVSIRIVEMMNGMVTFKSKPGKGTKVVLSLPIEKENE